MSVALGTCRLARIEGRLTAQAQAIAELHGMVSDLRDRLVPP